MMEGQIRQMLDKALRSHAEYECAWWKNERRGRWVVLRTRSARILLWVSQLTEHIKAYEQRWRETKRTERSARNR